VGFASLTVDFGWLSPENLSGKAAQIRQYRRCRRAFSCRGPPRKTIR